MTSITIQLTTMSLSGSINVINRKGEIMPLHLETISKRLNELAEMSPKLNISTDIIAIKTASSLIDGIFFNYCFLVVLLLFIEGF